MKTWKKIFIVALCVIAVCFATIVIGIGVEYVQNKRLYREWVNREPMWVSKYIQMERNADYVRLKDSRTGKYTSPKLYHIYTNEYGADSIVVFQKQRDGKRGYVNLNTGKIVIEPQFDKAWNFSEGVAATFKDGVLSFVRQDGSLAIPTTFNVTLNGKPSFQFHGGYCVMSSPEGKWGLIDHEGNWQVEPIYNGIDAPYHGYRPVTNGEQYGLLTLNGDLALPVEYDAIDRARSHEGFYLTKDGLCQEVDFSLQVTKPFVHNGLHLIHYVDDYIYVDDYPESREDVEIDFFRFRVGCGYGIVDAKGKVILPAKYTEILRVNKHIFEVELSFSGEKILVNTKGQIVSQPTNSN